MIKKGTVELFLIPCVFFRAKVGNDMKVPTDVSKLKEWFKAAQLDPNDPSNVGLFELLKV